MHQTKTAIAALVLAVATFAGPLNAALFVVPPDRDLVGRADVVVTATTMSSVGRPTEEGGVETVTTLVTGEVIKGMIGRTFEVTEPGGSIGDRFLEIAGVPHFEPGTEVLLFLRSTGANRWSVADLVIGKFDFRSDVSGARVLVREEDEVTGWDPDGSSHKEGRREAASFLEYIRALAAGREARDTYQIEARPLSLGGLRAPRLIQSQNTAASSTSSAFTPVSNIAPYTATSYTSTISGSMGARWTVFPAPVTFFSGTTAEPGAPGGGVTAISAAFAAWNNDCGSNVYYLYGGVDNGTHTKGLGGPDGANTILFERDLSSYGVVPFVCTAVAYSGTLGLGGITSASGTNVLGSETFATTREADVEMNRGIANCALLFNNGDFNSAVAHEVGHTLGFRHSDQNRSSSAACTTDPSLECSNTAIMKSFITNGINATLQAWDQHAVQAVYPGNVCAPTSTGSTVVKGDANGDGTVTVADVFYLINFLFSGGPAPVSGDANGDGTVTVADVFYLINFLFSGGPAPR